MVFLIGSETWDKILLCHTSIIGSDQTYEREQEATRLSLSSYVTKPKGNMTNYTGEQFERKRNLLS